MYFKIISICGVISVISILYLLTQTLIHTSKNISPINAVQITLLIIVCLFAVLFWYISKTEKIKENILQQYSQIKTIIDDTPFMIFLRDVNGKIIHANKYFLEVTGNKNENIIGQNIHSFCNPNKLDILQKEDEEVVRTKQPYVTERQICLNGVTGWYKIMKYPVYDKDGNVVKLVILYENIDDEKDLEERKNTFIATLTHDLKTPTIAQIKATDILLDQSFGYLDCKQRELVTQMQSSHQYVYDLIFTMLNTYLYDNGQIKISNEEIYLNDLVTNAVNHLSDSYKEKDQTIIINNNCTSSVLADKSQIQRVIMNLVSNAINYGFKNSDINIELTENNSQVEFKITNHSKYIPADRLEDIFEKYKKSCNTRFFKTSTGLGLYLSKQIIDAHNGNIYAQSDVNETCTFGFSLPII